MGYRIEFIERPIYQLNASSNFLHKEGRVHAGRDPDHAGQTGNFSGQGKHSFLAPKKSGGEKSVINLKRLNQSVRSSTSRLKASIC